MMIAAGQPNRNTPNRRGPIYESHISEGEAIQGVTDGKFVQGILRVNAKNFEQSFVDNPDEILDLYIHGLIDRNRALHSDEVVVRINHRTEWRVTEDWNTHASTSGGAPIALPPEDSLCLKLGSIGILREPSTVSLNASVTNKSEGPAQNGTPGKNNPGERSAFKRVKDYPSVAIPDEFLQKTAQVVCILSRNHSRKAVGLLNKLDQPQSKFAVFSPYDCRVPRILIPINDCPKDFDKQCNKYKGSLFVARIVEWPETSKMAKGSLSKCIGNAGEIGPETDGMLEQYNFSQDAFTPEVVACLQTFSKPDDTIWQIPQEEYKYRRDFREECVVTIDPPTARDLDDALHVKRLPNGRFEVGVHIADVAYFVPPHTALDKEASTRATSVYLVHKVVPMLPRLLCEELCSLNPGVERLSFSVVWEMDEEGHTYDQWIGRSIIKSNSKISYDFAQDFIDNPDKTDWSVDELPEIHGTYTAKEICDSVNQLHRLAVNIRQRRFSSGALRLNLPKMSFALSSETGMPVGCTMYKLRQSNRLIEEFMLLANMSIAKKIYDSYPKVSMLRRHKQPKPKVLHDSVEQCKAMGFPIDGSEAGAIQDSIDECLKTLGEQSNNVAPVIVHLCAKAMQV